MIDPKLTDEAGRLLALHRYCALDSLHEPDFDTITGIVKDLLGVPICAVSLIDRDEQRFKSIQGLNLEATPREQAFCDHTIRSKEIMVVPDAREDERFANNPLVMEDDGIRAYAGAPLITPDGYNVGALCAIHRRRHDFTPGDLQLLERFARIVVQQMEQRTLAHRDPLTGALTRRAFVDSAVAGLQHFDKEKRSATIAVLDLDHFKALNDEYGHAAGDELLKAVTETVQGELRDTDLFGRLGGEEFGILFYATTKTEALECAERVRKAIEGIERSGLPPVTVSMGLVSVEHSRDLDRGLAQAERALRAAKREGRNRCLFGGPRDYLAAA